ncbi:MAG: hypothetical protein JSR77_14230 [Planctomycetes bacterium]|nr:hypothetical protein [Planctomycetota bacterium]
MNPGNDPNPRQPTPSTAGPVNEELLLDWIEGRLSPKEAESLAKASGRPGLAARVAQMQADRVSLRKLPRERAPAVLMERTLAALEREALVGTLPAATEQAATAGIPVESYKIETYRGNRSMAPMRFALAAALVLLAGGAVYMGVSLVKPRKSPFASVGAIARNSDSATPTPGPEIQIAAKSAASDEAPAAATAQIAAAAEPEPMFGPPASQEITSAAHAAGLAREGRLVVRVVGVPADKIARLSAKDQSWRFRGSAPRDIAATLAAAIPSHDSDNAAGDAPRIASRASNESQPLPASQAASFVGPPLPQTPPAAYVAEIADSAEAISALRQALESRFKAGVEFGELTDPVNMTREPDASDVLWWTQGPSAWTSRLSIPVVIEQR